MQVQGIVNAPSNTSNPDGASPVQLMGKSAEGIVAELHGKWYTAAYRAKLFIASTLIAGVTLPVNTTTAPTYTLYNPVGSGVNVELVSLDVGWPAAATTVVATLLGSVSFQLPSSTTQGGIILSNPLNNTNISTSGVSAGQAKLFTAATIVAITTHMALLNVTSTADAMTASHYEWDGRVLLGPGSLMTITSSPVQTGVAMPTLAYAEWAI
jgi:hypothetical protein